MKYYINIKGITYNLPMGMLYIQKFEHLLNGDVIELTGLPEEQLNDVLDHLFFHISMSLCALDDDFGPEDVVNEKLEIRRMISEIDIIQKYYTKKRNYEKSNEIMLTFIERMLKYNQNLMDNNYPLDR